MKIDYKQLAEEYINSLPDGYIDSRVLMSTYIEGNKNSLYSYKIGKHEVFSTNIKGDNPLRYAMKAYHAAALLDFILEKLKHEGFTLNVSDLDLSIQKTV